MQPVGHKYDDSNEFVRDCKEARVKGLCLSCQKQMPGVIPGGEAPDIMQATVVGWESLVNPATGHVMWWYCPDCWREMEAKLAAKAV